MKQEDMPLFQEAMFLPDLGLTKKDAQVLLDQYISQQISEDDFWWSLGFDFEDKKSNKQKNNLLNFGSKVSYLVNVKKKKNVAHIWLNGDTACRCYANGSLGNKKNFQIIDTTNERLVCENCLNKM